MWPLDMPALVNFIDALESQTDLVFSEGGAAVVRDWVSRHNCMRRGHTGTRSYAG